MGRAFGQQAGGLLRAQFLPHIADQVDTAFEFCSVDNDADAVTVAELAQRPSGQGLGRNQADAGPRAHAGETRSR